MDYKKLKSQYPETVTMEQFYQIARISKRKARWLLENEVIPCEDSGKKTRRFKIQLADIIAFLQKQENGTLDVAIPSGIFASGAKDKPPREYLDPMELSQYFLDQWCNMPDMLTVKYASDLCGYVSTSILRWINQGQVQGILYRERYLISKESLARFLASAAGQDVAVKSAVHLRLLDDFCAQEQNSGMEFGSMSL